MKLEALTHPNDDRELVHKACFYVGWKLRSPDSWEYNNVFTGERGEVVIDDLAQAIKAKQESLNPKVVPSNKFPTTNRKKK